MNTRLLNYFLCLGLAKLAVWIVHVSSTVWAIRYTCDLCQFTVNDALDRQSNHARKWHYLRQSGTDHTQATRTQNIWRLSDIFSHKSNVWNPPRSISHILQHFIPICINFHFKLFRHLHYHSFLLYSFSSCTFSAFSPIFSNILHHT